MKPFCEIIVSDVLPAMRAVLANELLKTYNLNQTEVSKKLGMTQPAISQYTRELRGQRTKIIRSNEKIMGLVKRLAREIALGNMSPKDLHKQFCMICKKIREEGLICKMHGNAWPSLGSCDICFK
jgi:predicted transcriptional regulator